MKEIKYKGFRIEEVSNGFYIPQLQEFTPGLKGAKEVVRRHLNEVHNNQVAQERF